MSPARAEQQPANRDPIQTRIRVSDNGLKTTRSLSYVFSQWSAWSWLIFLGGVLAVGLPIIAIRTISQPRNYIPQQADEAVAVQAQVSALGRLEPAGGVRDVGIPLGSIVETMLVKEGDTVEKGEILAYLNGHQEQLANRNFIASQVDEANRRLQANIDFESAQIDAAKIDFEGVAAPQTDAIAAQEALIRRVSVEYSQAQSELSRIEQLYQQGAVAKQTFDQQQGEVLQLQEEINSQQATLEQLSANKQKDLENAAAQIFVAEAGLERAEAQNQLTSLQRNLDLAEAQLAKTIIRAPQEGQVLRIFTEAGESAIENGQGGGTLLQLGNNEQMFVVAEVYESDASRVRPGQSATITSRNGAFPGDLKGTVESVGKQIYKNNILNDDPAALDDARIVEVEIRLENSEPVKALTNLQTDVRIDVRKSESEEDASLTQSAPVSPKTDEE